MLITHPNRRRDPGQSDQFTHTQSSQHKSSAHDPAQPSTSERTLRASAGLELSGFPTGSLDMFGPEQGVVDVSRITPSEAQGWCITPFRPRKHQETRLVHCYQKEANWPLRRGFMSGAEGI